MSVASRAMGRFLGLPPAVTHHVRLHRDIPVRARDGVLLLTDHYAPTLPSAPTVLVRTPYGRRGVLGLTVGRVLAERGFHVVMQSCRGTFGSGGVFAPMRHEREDGLDTVAWLTERPWFDGNLFTYGPSYVGFTQWAIAAEAGPMLRGMLTAVTASSFREPTYAGGSFSLDTILNWATLVHNQGGSLASFLVKQSRSQPRIRRAWQHLPLEEVDMIGAGAEIAFFREWLRNAEDESYWQERGHSERIEATTAAVCMVGGWQDIFLPWQLTDYARMRAAGHRPRLVIGPWTHASRGLFAASMREAISFFRAQLDSTAHPERDDRVGGVRVYVSGAEGWRDLDEWPPAGRDRAWRVRPGGALDLTGPGTSDELLGDGGAAGAEARKSDRIRYDPADPTPSPGGPLLTTEAGPVDNAAVEARSDVLVYTSPLLSEPVEAIGPVHATVAVRTSADFFDVFVRVCDVHPDGRSINVCDGLTRVDPRAASFSSICRPDRDGIRSVAVPLWPTAHRWQAGHRIRVQIAGGAHPRYARNTGTGEPLATAAQLRPVDIEVFGALVTYRDRTSTVPNALSH